MLWALVAVSAAIVVAILVLPAFRSPRDVAGRSEYDVNVYKDQLAELDREAADGRIGGAEVEAARLEIQRRMLAAADVDDRHNKGKSRGPLPIFIAAAAAPMFAIVFYMQSGSPTVPNHPFAERTDVRAGAAAAAPGATHPGGNAMPMDAAIDTLERRLADNPEDIDGWILLARSYGGSGNMEKAAEAYAKAVPLTDRHPMILADWAEARLMARQGNFTPEIFNDFHEARTKDPALPKPWFYIGLDKAMGGDFEGAVQLWTDLLTIAPPSAPFVPAVREQIARAARDGGFDPAGFAPSDSAREIAAQRGQTAGEAAAPPVASVPRGPSQEDVEAAQQMSDEDRNAFIRTMVQSLADRLEENPNDPQGWERLIRAYEVLGETDKAAAARDRLNALGGG